MREVRIHDTLTGTVVPLQPREPGRVGIYACGPTVYSRIHVGNARPFVVFSLLKRFLAACGYEAELVINVTDVNDKIYDAAREAGVGSAQLAAEMTAAYIADTDLLGLGRPDAEPLATETIGPIVDHIAELIETGHAYASEGDVYFAVRSFESYGKLSNRPVAEMDQGEEAGDAARKRDPLDFALWKAAKPGEDTAWEAPWGRGRPGWHIECSAMAEAELGPDFAIHGGGADLVFPHHENEIAQSEAARGVPLARIWMHNGMLQTDSQKMSKSVGNIFQLSEAIRTFGAEAIVAYLVSGHYRKPLEFSPERVEQAAAGLNRIRNYLQGAAAAESGEDQQRPGGSVGPGGPDSGPSGSGGADPVLATAREAFMTALADDFNTPLAMAALHELVAEANRRPVRGAAALLGELLEVLGLGSVARDARDSAAADAESRELLDQRQRARAERDYAAADRIRDELAERGWQVRDTAEGAELVPIRR